MLDAIIDSHPALKQYLSMYWGCFQNAPQYRHFQHYVVALLIWLGHKNLAGLEQAVGGETSASSLYRFLAQQPWEREQVEASRQVLLNRHARRVVAAHRQKGKRLPVFLCIDDSLVEKTGKHMEAVAKHYSHTDQRLVLGHVWVTGHLVVAGMSYPVSYRLYRRQDECTAAGVPFSAKTDLAQAIVRAFEPLPDTQTYVLTDSWYPSEEMLTVCAQRHFFYLSAAKADRKLSYSGQARQAQQWLPLLPKRAFDFVTVKATRYKVWQATVRLSSGHTVRWLANRALRHKTWNHVFSTDLSLSAQTLLSYYLVRWEVENFYRTAKQCLGWGDYQVRDLQAMQTHVLLMMVTYIYLELQRQVMLASVDPNAHFTLGDVQRQHQQLAHRATIAQVFHFAQAGLALEAIYDKLAA